MIQLPSDNDDRCGFLGIKLPRDHPFNAACRFMHDPAFTSKHLGHPTRGRAVADYALLKSWLGTARDRKSPLLAIQAVLLWPFAKVFGGIIWNFGTAPDLREEPADSLRSLETPPEAQKMPRE